MLRFAPLLLLIACDHPACPLLCCCSFRKLWGRIDTPLKAGDKVEIKIANRWNTYSFQGRKSVVLGTTNWLGSQNPFLGIAFLSTGGVSLLMAAIYGLLRCFVPDRKFGDPLTLADVRD
jgi:hypothetical protein